MSASNCSRLVFISHSSQDTWVARQIAREISLRGAQPFLDEADVDVGAEFEEDIREFLDKADELLVLFTPWALVQEYLWSKTMTEKSDYNIFLSYSSKDQPWVSEFVATLKEAGVKAWFDVSDLAPGERWQEKIQKALRDSEILVVILSQNSIASPWTFFELGAAVADQKRIIPIVTEDFDFSKFPLLLKQYKLLKESSPQAAGKLVAEVLAAESKQ